MSTLLAHLRHATHRVSAHAVRSLLASLLLALPLLSCADKSLVSALGPSDARLGVSVALGELVRDHEITGVRIGARYSGPAGVVLLREVTEPYTEGQSRTVGLTIPLDACYRDVADAAQNGCPVQIRVEVLGDNRVFARDELPVVRVRSGETATPAALAARVATSLRLLTNGTAITAPLSVNGNSTTQLVAEPLDAAGAAIAGRTIAWTTSDASIATVNSTGLVTAVANGNAVITASTGTGNGIVRGTASFTVNVRQPASVALSPSSVSLTVAQTRQLTASVRDAAGAEITPTPALTYSSSASTIATVDASGLVVAVAPGSATITARTANGVLGTATITVVAAAPVPASVELAPATASVPVGGTQALTPTVRDASQGVISPVPTLTWSSSAATIATVSATGVVTGVAPGSATITARTANGITGTASITVAAPGSFSGRVYDYETNTGVRGASVSLFSGTTLLRTVTTDTSGNFAITGISGGPFDLRATATGYVDGTLRTPVADGVRVLDPLPLVRVATGGGIVSGNVVSATTGQFILTPLTVELYNGVGTPTGSPTLTTSSNPNGGYAFSNVAAGTYTLVARGSGYLNATRTVVSYGAGRTAANQNVTLAPTSGTALLRIVLTWADAPSDLDSHLTGPVIGNVPLWVYFGSTGFCSQSPFACLDVDAVSGRGPETITITRTTPGRYVYSVHNYSAAEDVVTDFGLARSNARVDVYGPNGLLQSFLVPSSGGTLWTVFEWDGTTIRPINRMEGSEPPARDAAGRATVNPDARLPQKRAR